MKKGKLLISIVAIAAAAVVVIVLLLAPMINKTDDYTSNIKKAQEYYEAGDYNKAIIAYKTALEQNENGIEAYEGLAGAYIASGYTALASETINAGLMVSRSPILMDYDKEIAQKLSEAKGEPNAETAAAAEQEVAADKKATEEKKEKEEKKPTPKPEAQPAAESETAQNETAENEEDTNEADENALYPIEGHVIDAATGNAVEGASVKAYEGYTDAGEPVEGTTDTTGEYTLELKGGNYHVTVEKKGYIKGVYDIFVLPDSPAQTFDFAITEELEDAVIRIVLTWGEYPVDLDSYLYGTSSSGSYVQSCFHILKAYDENGALAAELDLDDRDSYGPETTTLYDVGGSYTFKVRDFLSTGALGSSGAVVNIYMGSELKETIEVPADAENAWDVCRIENGTITVVNTACADDFR